MFVQVYYQDTEKHLFSGSTGSNNVCFAFQFSHDLIVGVATVVTAQYVKG